MKNKIRRVLTGLVFIGIGIGYIGTQFKWWDFTIFFPGWWSLFLILPAVYSMFDYGIRFSNVCIGCIGFYYLLQANDLITVRLTFPMIMAIGCICIGIKLMFVRRVTWYEYKANEFQD